MTHGPKKEDPGESGAVCLLAAAAAAAAAAALAALAAAPRLKRATRRAAILAKLTKLGDFPPSARLPFPRPEQELAYHCKLLGALVLAIRATPYVMSLLSAEEAH